MTSLFKKNWFAGTLVISFLLYHFKIGSNLEFYYDDWFFINIIKNSDSFFQNFNILREIYIVRPVGMIYLTFLTFFEYGSIIYIYIFNIFLWLLSGMIVAQVLSKKLPLFSKYFFLFFYLIPSISNSFIYSPIIQGLGTVSVFFWSVSLYLVPKKNKLHFSILFIFLSLFTYELTIALVPLNIFLYMVSRDLLKNKINQQLIFILKLFCLSLFLLILFYVLQKYLGSFSEAKIIKYGFLEKDFIENVVKYFFTPFKLILIEIPSLWINGLVLFYSNINFLDFLLLITVNVIILYSLFKKKIINEKISLKYLFWYNLILVIIFIGIFLMYLVATSVPDLKGYYNRGLLGLHIWISLFLMQLLYFKNYLRIVFITIGIFVINLNLISFYEQEKIHLNNSLIRKEIIKNTFEIANKDDLIFVNFETYSETKYNSIPIFSDEVYDYSNAIQSINNGLFIANRIYQNKECKKILEIKNEIFQGMVPSRNRKIKEDQMIEFLTLDKTKIPNQTIIIYDYNKNNISKGNVGELQNMLKTVFNCN
jgi:hypothetical protein